MKKLFTILAATCCLANLLADDNYQPDNAIVSIGASYITGAALRAGEIPELKAGELFYDAATHTLTMSNVEIEASSGIAALTLSCAQMDASDQNMNIRLIGNNTITMTKSKTMSMYLGTGHFVFSGMNGTLNIYSNEGRALTLSCESFTLKEGCHIYAGAQSTYYAAAGIAVFFADPAVTIDCAKLDAWGTQCSISGCNPTLIDAVQSTNYEYSTKKSAFVDGSDNIVNSTAVSFTATKYLLFAMTENDTHGTVTMTVDGNTVSNPYRFTDSEIGQNVNISVTPDNDWTFKNWDMHNVTESGSKKNADTYITLAAANQLAVARLKYTQPATPTRPWYLLSNSWNSIFITENLADGPGESTVSLSQITHKTILFSTYANGHIYYIEKGTGAYDYFFYSVDIDPTSGTLSNRQPITLSTTYAGYQALCYSFADNVFYTAVNSGGKQWLASITMSGKTTLIGELKGANFNAGYNRYFCALAADSKGNLYGMYYNGESITANDNFRLGMSLYNIDPATASTVFVGKTGHYGKASGCAMAFDYATDELVAIFANTDEAHWATINTLTGQATQLSDSKYEANGLFQILPGKHSLTVYTDPEFGEAAINGTATSGYYLEGTTVSLSAKPTRGEYQFAQWEDGNTDNPRDYVITDQDVTLKAEFELKSDVEIYPVSVLNPFGYMPLTNYTPGQNKENNANISAGYIEYNPETNRLIINNLSLTGDNRACLRIGDENEARATVKIYMIDGNSLVSSGDMASEACLELTNADVTFEGPGSANIDGQFKGSGIKLNNADLTFNGATVNVSASEYGIFGTGSETVTFRGAMVTVKGTNTAAIAAISDMPIEYCDITAPSVNTAFNAETQQVEDNNNVVKGLNNPVVFQPWNSVQCYPVNEGTGTFTITTETETFENIAWVQPEEKYTITAEPVSGYDFGYWHSGLSLSDEELVNATTPEQTMGITSVSVTAQFFYDAKSDATWYGVNNNKFISFMMSDHGAEVAKATSNAAGVKAGDFMDGQWVFLNSSVQSMPFSQLIDGEEMPDYMNTEKIANTTQDLTDMAYDIANNVTYAVAGSKLFRLNIEDSKLDELGTFQMDGSTKTIIAIAVDKKGTIYALQPGDPGVLYTVALIDEELKKVELEPVGSNNGSVGEYVPSSAHALAFDYATDELFWGASDYIRLIDTESAKTFIVADLGFQKGSQGVVKSMHRMAQLYKITVKLGPDCEDMGTVSVNNVGFGNGKFIGGTKATITATPADGYHFLYWKRGTSDTEYKDAVYTFNVNANRTYYAYFAKNAQAIDNIESDTQAEKILIDGHLYIIKEGRTYTPQGALVK